MNKTWLIARHHFSQEVRKRSFILLLLALPLFLAFSVGFGSLAQRLEQGSTTLGYVDPANLLADPTLGPQKSNVRLVRYETAADARQALETGEIDAYYLLPEEGKRRAELIYFEPPDYRAARHLQDLVRWNLLADRPPLLAERVVSGAQVTVRAIERNREFPGGNPSASLLLPAVGAAIFAFLVLTTFGYMAEALVVEKENRTIEIIISSVSTTRLMAGKIIGALAIALVQLVTWLACLALAVWLGGTVLEIEWLANLQPNWRDLAMIVIVALPSYLFLGALTTLVGSTLVETQEAQQMGAMAFALFYLPILLIIPLAKAPNGSLALGFTFFPMTAVTTIALRSLLIEVPTWQVAVSAGVALVCGLGAVWLAGKALRVSLLRYGQRPRWGELVGRAGVRWS
jgi:ABC-2 type transport system permease protein